VIGLCKLPFDGNPSKAVGLIAHPGSVSGLCCSMDATLIATSGGADCTVS
jgi:hypothetical protein